MLWLTSFGRYFEKRIFVLFLLGMMSGLPFALSSSTLYLWLKESGIDKTTIGLFALAQAPYGLKFFWAPFIDKLQIPLLTKKLGQRHSWLYVTLALMIALIVFLGSLDPLDNAQIVAFAAFLLAFTSASFDISLAAYRIESLPDNEQGMASAAEVTGWRLGAFISTGIGLNLVDFGSWHIFYYVMAGIMGLGIFALMFARKIDQDALREQKSIYQWFEDAVIAPFANFMSHKGWLWILLFILLYKAPDAFLVAMLNPFYSEMGFSAGDIGNVAKVFGLTATIFGAFYGGVLIAQVGILRGLWITLIVQSVVNLAFLILVENPGEYWALATSISIENFGAGMSTTAAVAFLSSLCNRSYSATQFALLSSIISVPRIFLSSVTGWMADNYDWTTFFIASALTGIPAMVLLIFIQKYIDKKSNTE